MKRTKHPIPTVTVDKPQGSGPKHSTAVEKNKLENTGTPSRKNSSQERPGSHSKPLTKSFGLSKSQDNLASVLRKKAAAEKQQLRDGNKENLMSKPNPSTPKFKTPKGMPGTPIHKSQSTQNISKTDTPIKRAQSAQNINKASDGKVSEKKTPGSVKKASSAHNISRDKAGVRQVRISAPGNAMAYNAELLASFEKEKKLLERRISDLTQLAENRKNELEKYRIHVKNLKEQSKECKDSLNAENDLLKDRLQELGVTVEPITDTEKLIQKKNNESNSATGGGEFLPLKSHHVKQDSGDTGDARSADSEAAFSLGDFSCTTPDHPSSLSLDNWDKQSTKSDGMSEISVACLQDRISQMEETHYSTNEELQATLQELTDLQDAVNDLSNENERLADERSVLLESLCAQTEKLENCRMQIEHLKALLVSESEGGDRSENERQLVALVKSAHEEKEEFLLRQMEYNNALHSMENESRELQDIIAAMRDRQNIQEMKTESVQGDKKALENQITELKEINATETIELSRYKTLLENEKSKVAELEQFRKATDKSDIEEMLDNARQEKDKVESRLANLQEKLAVCQNEVAKLKDQLSITEAELKVSKNNAKGHVSDLEYKMAILEKEKSDSQKELESARDHIDQLQADCDRFLDENKGLGGKVSETQSDLTEARQRVVDKDTEVREIRQQFQEQQAEWQQFQADLQTAVVIANDIKSETQEDMDKLVEENQNLTDKNDLLKLELCKMVEEMDTLRIQQRSDSASRSDIRGRMLSTVGRELSKVRKLSDVRGQASQNQSVKNLIATIEHQVKHDRCTPPMSPSVMSQNSSRRNSTDSVFSVSSFKQEPSPTKVSQVVERRASVPASSDSSLKSGFKKMPETRELGQRHTLTNIIYERPPPATDDEKSAPSSLPCQVDGSPSPSKKQLTSILSTKTSNRRNSCSENENTQEKNGHSVHASKDPLAGLAKQMGGSKRNALLKWCQMKTKLYANIDITNFSSSWNDGLAFCALIHSYLPNKIPYAELDALDKKRNFTLAFQAAESVGISSSLRINDMVAIERPDWQAVMFYVTSLYKHFEVDAKAGNNQ